VAPAAPPAPARSARRQSAAAIEAEAAGRARRMLQGLLRRREDKAKTGELPPAPLAVAPPAAAPPAPRAVRSIAVPDVPPFPESLRDRQGLAAADASLPPPPPLPPPPLPPLCLPPPPLARPAAAAAAADQPAADQQEGRPRRRSPPAPAPAQRPRRGRRSQSPAPGPRVLTCRGLPKSVTADDVKAFFAGVKLENVVLPAAGGAAFRRRRSPPPPLSAAAALSACWHQFRPITDNHPITDAAAAARPDLRHRGYRRGRGRCAGAAREGDPR